MCLGIIRLGKLKIEKSFLDEECSMSRIVNCFPMFHLQEGIEKCFYLFFFSQQYSLPIGNSEKKNKIFTSGKF